MSARFWLFSSVCAGAALVGGYGLGLYATTSPRAALETALPQTTAPETAAYDSAALNGPAIVDCKGCGPTLADRQMAADNVGWDGMNDPVVRAYAAQDEPVPIVDVESSQPPAAQPRSVQALPASIERFAAGESEGNWGSVKIVRVQNSKTPAEEAPAGAAVSY